MRKTLLPLLIILVMMSSACVVQTETVVLTHTPSAEFVPTSTPKYLSLLYDLQMFLGGDGWATSLDKNHIYITPDFGEHWMEVTPRELAASDKSGNIYAFFANSQLAWVCQSLPETAGVLYVTSDQGRNWSKSQLDFPCGPMGIVSSQVGYVFSSEGVGLGSNYVSVHKTEDAGLTWTTMFTHEPGSVDDHGLPTGGIKSQFAVLSEDTLLVGGSIPAPGWLYLFKSNNAGVSWSQVECPGLPDADDAELAISNIFRISGNEVIIAIQAYLPDYDSVPTHYCGSSDGGESWAYLSSLENVAFSDFGSFETGVAFADGKMYQTSDGGITWQDVSSGLPPAITPVAVDMVSSTYGFLTTSISPETMDQNRIYMTVNNGTTWQSMPGIIVEP